MSVLDKFMNKSATWLHLYDFIRRRRFNYQATFGPVHGKAVLRDLAPFCRAYTSTFHTDARIHAMLEGRREVWLRIQQHLNLQPDDLTDLYLGPNKDI